MTTPVPDMDIPATVLSSEEVYRGAIFSVDERTIALHRADGTDLRIHRQVIRHAPAVVMLVEDSASGRYLVEREYRAGSNSYAYGLPAGLVDDGEDIQHAALRELEEETGIITDPAHCLVEPVGTFFSSEGMTDEAAHVMIIRIASFTQGNTHFDADEHVESMWVDWQKLNALPIHASNSVIAIQAEQLRRALGS